MIEIWHEMIRYDVHFNEILCCDCFYDEIYFLLRQKVNYEIFEERFLKVENCYFDLIYGTVMVICHDFLKFSSGKYKFSNKNCVTDIIPTKPDRTVLCSICTIDVFRKADILHIFKLKW